MKKIIIILSVAVLVLIIMLGLWFLGYESPPEGPVSQPKTQENLIDDIMKEMQQKGEEPEEPVVVEISEQGFSENAINIKQGGIVNFKNSIDEKQILKDEQGKMLEVEPNIVITKAFNEKGSFTYILKEKNFEIKIIVE